MRKTDPHCNECTPEKKAIHMEFAHQLKEKKRLLGEIEYEMGKGTIELSEYIKRETQIMLEYDALMELFRKNMR